MASSGGIAPAMARGRRNARTVADLEAAGIGGLDRRTPPAPLRAQPTTTRANDFCFCKNK
jgi:hypothetical protein